MDTPSPSTAPPPAVTVENLTKVFKSGFTKKPLLAVRQLSFTVGAGEVYGLIGPNGCGKSTTMKVMLGLLKATQGRATIFGRDSEEVASRQDVGFLPENPYFYKHLSGRETLNFYGKLCGLRGSELKGRTEAMLELTGLTHAAERRIGGYSKGMLQRVGLAQALIHEPRLLILDEPTAGVDPVGSRRIRDLILELKERGITIVVTSHLLEQMQEVCDRVGIMSNGRMVSEGKLEDLISVENQTELILQDASPELLARIHALVQESGGKSQLISEGKPRTTLEKLFLQSTTQTGDGE
ncbi:ABC transporter ATP-binding protein [Verrucomicrobium sp. BvORR106]|uniref:ABC transporter ATP-binding protein n=1 Tax=Verrucomicrobium sp. BvORR106 TaxID=1403819 RepID=UPI00056FDE45|nr:ABC transporter ATP-binding protein [Verrucomicrobium sp. BvORR106]